MPSTADAASGFGPDRVVLPVARSEAAAETGRDPIVVALEQVAVLLRSTPVGALTRSVMIEQIAALEVIKNTASARQGCLAVVFDVAERDVQAQAGVPVREQGRGVAEQIGLARQESPARAARFLNRSRILFYDLPETMGRHVAGEVSEYRAGLIATEVALLDAEGRAEVDRELNAFRDDPTRADRKKKAAGVDLGGMSDRALRAAAAAAAYRVDPSIIRRRGRHAESERFVSLRPAPDTMTILSAYLPVREGVACYAALKQAADSARAAGDPRSRGQVMADTLIARLTGAEQAGQLPVELQIVLTADDLVAEADAEQPADGDTDVTPTGTDAGSSENTPGAEVREGVSLIAGYGPVPSATVRDWLRESLDAGGKVWIRRLLTDPITGEATAIDSRARYFPLPVRRLILARDRYCRTPYCGAPIRHLDHASDYATGGTSTPDNGQGLCERCNQAKTAPGWTARAIPDPLGLGRHLIETTTPTGHTYRSTAPQALPGLPVPGTSPTRAG